MEKNLVWIAGVVSLAAGMAMAQPPGELIDVYSVRVRPEKRQAFDAAIGKMADTNRRHNGDRWVAYSTVYGGESGTVYFASRRDNMAGVDQGMQAFEKAVAKGIGAANVQKFFGDYLTTIQAERGEIRMRRQDLSLNVPDSVEGRLRMVAESRYLRTTMVRARPGMMLGVVDVWKKIRSSMERGEVKSPVAVLQAVTGPGGVFYFTSYARSFEDLGAQTFDLPKAMGEEAFRSLQKDISEVVAESRVEIYKLLPELSNPPEEFLSAAPDFWKPKTAVAAAKTKPVGGASSQ